MVKGKGCLKWERRGQGLRKTVREMREQEEPKNQRQRAGRGGPRAMGWLLLAVSWESSGRGRSRDFLQGFPRIATGEGRAWDPEQDPCRKWISSPCTQNPTPLLPGLPGLCSGCAQGPAHPHWLTHSRPFSSLNFLAIHREAISKSCLNHCRGSKAKSEDHRHVPTITCLVWAIITHHCLTSAPCSFPPADPGQASEGGSHSESLSDLMATSRLQT